MSGADGSSETAIDALIADFYAAFDNRYGAVVELASLVRCFTDKAIVVRRAETGADLYTVEEFALPRIALLTGGTLVDFHEWETSATTRILAGLATRTSRYAKSGLLDGGDHAGLGTKCSQIVELDGGWRIASLAWVDDVP